MSMLPSFFRTAVVAIGVPLNDGKVKWCATGFLVGKYIDNNKTRANLFLITNKHVVNGLDSVRVRFNRKKSPGVKDCVVTLRNGNKKNYTEHPNPSVDVVAIKLHGGKLMQTDSEVAYFDLESHSLTLKQMSTTGVEEGGLVYAIGFPMGIVEEEIKAPFVRLGCISRINDSFNHVGDSAFFVDAQTFPGNSGGPVVSVPEAITITGTAKNTNANLIGVLCAYKPYVDRLISSQTQEIVMLHRENSGLTKVFPVDRIKEVVEIEEKRFGKQSR